MDRHSSALRPKSQVYVEVPPSPMVASRSGTTANLRVRQENTPLKAVAMNVDYADSSAPSLSSNPQKRKSMDSSREGRDAGADLSPSKAKKAKTDICAQTTCPSGPLTQEGQTPIAVKPSDAPVKLVRCHQCTRQVDSSVAVHCSALRPSGQQCVLNYCKACMRNRYQKDADAIKSGADACTSTEKRSEHAPAADYIFRCPRCRNVCNCRICRKAQGLPATGDLHLLARKAAKSAAMSQAPGDQGAVHLPRVATATAVSGNPRPAKQAAAMLSKPHICKYKPHVLVPPSPYAPRSSVSGVQAEKPKQRRGRPKQMARVKPIPEPLWTRLPTSLNYDAAQERMNLREFLLRFSHLSEIARGHLEELEEVGSGTWKECSSVSESRLATWISEPALKGIFVGLLTVLSRDSELDGEVQVITKAIQGIKAAGVNLNKIWTALATLRENSSVVLPDPLPRPSRTTRLGTRSVVLAQDASHSIVLSTAQFVPVVSALTDRMLQTKIVREDFDRAAAQEKDLSRAARELTAEENRRWKVLFDAKDGTRDSRRATRTAHKDALTAIEHAHKVAMIECLPRFAPLGRDADGRVYFVLSPGMIEREAAVDLLEGGRGEVKWGKRRGIADEAQRKRMRYWSWHLAVWGRKPKGAHVTKVARGEDAEDDEEDDEESEGWWGFWEPTEVVKLSEWLAAQYGIEIETKNASKDAEGVPIDEATKVHPTAAQDSEGNARGRPSNASSTADTSTEASSSRIRTFTSLNRESSHDDHEDVRTSDSDDGDDSLYSRVDSRGQPVPRRQDLIALVKRLREYADLLNWRIKRASKESKEGAEKAEGSDKGKAVRKEEAIPTQTFYGK